MDKKYLGSLPVPPQKPSKKERLTAQIINTKAGDILAVFVFRPSGELQMKIFIGEGDWQTQDTDGKWSRQTLTYIRYGRGCYYYIYKGDFEISVADSDVITKYYKDALLYEKVKDYSNSGVDLIQQHMDLINRNKTIKRADRAAEYKEAVFAKVTELPADIDKWVNDSLLPQSRYMLMRRKAKNAECKQAFCTYCGQEVNIDSNDKHNDIGFCPNCDSEVIHKNNGLVKNGFSDSADFYIVQCAGVDVFIRFFTATKKYNGEWRTHKPGYCEKARYYFTAKKVDMWKQNIGTGWVSGFYKCKKFYSVCDKGSLIYNRKLDEQLKGSSLESVPLDGVVGMKPGLDIINYIKAHQKYPFIEYLIKSGLNKISDEIINNSDYQLYNINSAAKSLHDVFGVTRQDLQLIRKYDCKLEQVRLLGAIRAAGHYLDETDFQFLLKETRNSKESHYKSDARLDILKFCSPKQLVNYLIKQMRIGHSMYKDYDVILSDWSDYLKEAQKLNYDVTDQSILRPKDLNERHAVTAALCAELANVGINDKITQRAEELTEKYGYADDKYCIVIPMTVYDITHEGAMQGHCVGGYAASHANSETTILFLRKAEAPHASYYTIEMKGNFIVQCRGYKNRDDIDNQRPLVDEFLQRWQKHIKKSRSKTLTVCRAQAAV